MVEPNKNNNQDLIEALRTEEDDDIVITRRPNSPFREKFKSILLIAVIITVMLIIIIWLLSLKSGGNKDFKYVENKMIEAAKSYYKDNKNLLPSNNMEDDEVSLNKLVTAGYMKSPSKYNSKATSCSGRVVVENNNGNYVYYSYLDCGDKYTSTELYKELIRDSNIVTSESGLYKLNNEYVFRGEQVNNYIRIDDSLWRIVKVDSNKDIVLILDNLYDSVYEWDNRYNNVMKSKEGYNDFRISRIKEFLDNLYNYSKTGNNKKSSSLLLSKSMAKSIVGFKQCYGNIDFNQTLNNNTYECQSVLENTKVGLLTVSDYINASIDKYCVSPSSNSCQNYNYLSSLKKSWWLANGNLLDNYKVYKVDASGKLLLLGASSYSGVRPVIHLSSKTLYSEGNGSITKPYIIK